MCCSALSVFKYGPKKSTEIVMNKPNEQQENDVLRRMLNTPHIPHKPNKESSQKPKPKT
jgi:hypothetical protein